MMITKKSTPTIAKLFFYCFFSVFFPFSLARPIIIMCFFIAHIFKTKTETKVKILSYHRRIICEIRSIRRRNDNIVACLTLLCRELIAGYKVNK